MALFHLTVSVVRRQDAMTSTKPTLVTQRKIRILDRSLHGKDIIGSVSEQR